jgi:hypothetical protein
MIANLLFAADLVDMVANPSSTLEEHEMGAARLAVLAAHGAGTAALSLQDASEADLDLLSGHIARWALNEAKRADVDTHETRRSTQAKRVDTRTPEEGLPKQAILQRLFMSETDRLCRMALTEAIITHPETERKLADFENGDPVPLEQLPDDTWPRNYLLELAGPREGETSPQQVANLTELGLLLLQIATPTALAFLGATVVTLRQRGMDDHPLLQDVELYAALDDELAQRTGFRTRPERFS